jgi:SSS family transporter
MEAYRTTIILACVGAYFLLCIVIGIWALRRTKSASDFFVAGRNLGVFVISIAVLSSTMSGFGFVGGPGLVYSMGMSSLWMIVCTTVSYPIAFLLLAKRMRMLAELRGAVSLPDIIVARYNSRASGFLTALAILLGVIGYLAANIRAMATVLQTLLADHTDISLLACAVISTSLLVFYCVTGGIIASVYTDLIQGVIMVVAAVLVFLAALSAVDGGLAGMTATIAADDPGTMSPWGTKGILGCLSWFFIFGLGMAGQPHIITKFMMNKRVEDARWSLPVTMFGYAVMAMLWISIGLVMRALVLQGQHESLATGDQAAPEFLQNYAHPVLAGVVFAGLFAAIMSTVDAFLNIGAAAVVHDMPKALTGHPPTRELLWARIATVVIAVLATGIAVFLKDLVAILGAFGWGTFAAAIVPVLVVGLNWQRGTALAACVAILASIAINFWLKTAAVAIPFSLDPGAVALLGSLTLYFAISIVSKPPKLAADVKSVLF